MRISWPIGVAIATAILAGIGLGLLLGPNDENPKPGLSLSDFDPGDDQDVLAKALILVGRQGRKNNENQDRAWYALDTPDWHASGELRDGSLAWNGMTVNRVVYFRGSKVFRFNDGDPDFHVGDSFAEGGVNRELTIWIQTETETVSFLAQDHVMTFRSGPGPNWINFLVPEASRTALDGIVKDDLIIVAVSEPHE